MNMNIVNFMEATKRCDSVNFEDFLSPEDISVIRNWFSNFSCSGDIVIDDILDLGYYLILMH